MEKKRAQVINIGKGEWWNEERQPSKADEIVIRNKKPRLAQSYFTVKQLADRLNVGVDCIYDYIRAGKLGCQIVGKRYRISEEHVEEFLFMQNKRLMRA